MGDFVHLHVHTEYSLLDGAIRVRDLVKRVKELGMKSVAITDHGVMYGVIEFYKEALKNNIKPILGCEVYTARRNRFDKRAGIDSEQGHLVLLAENNTGYKNLMKIVSIGFTEGYYYKPRIDMEVLKKYREGIIALSGCLSGDIPRMILMGDYEEARTLALQYEKIFGKNNFFLEIQYNHIPDQNLVNQEIIRLSKEIKIPLVGTNDAHYLKKEDAKAHDILLCIQTGKKISDEDRMKFNTNEVFLKSSEEMWESFRAIPEALENTVKIAERCNVEIEFNKLHLPEYKVPGGQEHFEFLKNLCYKGLENRYTKGVDKKTTERLDYELRTIKEMGYTDYFLIVWDFIRHAKEKEIMVGPGRGSGAGSLAAYCLGITNVDPIKYNLLFERFLNPERISMPDFDIDFCYERRQEVIDYVVDTYGEDRVAQIITFGTMAARAAIRDVGRALDISYGEVDIIAKMIPFRIGMTIDKALELNLELKEIYNNDLQIKELIDTSRLFEGMPRHASTHAAGVVISKEPIVEYVPLQKNDDNITTQFTMVYLEELGLLKMDFLGLRTLTVLRDAAYLIEKNYNIKIDFNNMKMDDPLVFGMISDAKTAGVFQLESSGMTQFMKELKPTDLEDIIAGISLYRPGPMDQIPRYLFNKNSPKPIEYDHPLLEDILDVTYGCMVYQEQVMQIVRELAGYSMGRADLVRRAMSKKKANIMKQERENFVYGSTDKKGNIIIKGAVRNGVDEKTANKIFDEMLDFASYAFPKAHAAAYAVVAYQTAWLKYYYPVEFMAAILNSFLGSTDKISKYISECKSMNIEILPPDINESSVKFSVVDGRIRFGMFAVKNAGENAVKEIIKEKEKNGNYISFKEFCERICNRDVNKKCIESLIKSGAFDSLGVYRSKLIASYEKLIDNINETRRKNLEGQLSLFDMGNSLIKKERDTDIYPNIKEYPTNVLLGMEKEMLGLYISGHPLDEFQEEIRNNTTIDSRDLKLDRVENGDALSETDQGILVENKNLTDKATVVVGGIIIDKTIKTTKNNNLMAFLTLEDLYGTIEIIVFPGELSSYKKILIEENIVFIKGRLSIREDEEPKIICGEVKTINEINDEKKENTSNSKRNRDNKIRKRKLYIRTNKEGTEEENRENMRPVLALLQYFSGNTPVYFYYSNKDELLIIDKNYWVNPNRTLISELKERFGNDNVKLV